MVEFFKPSEYECKCGCKMSLNQSFLKTLNQIRSDYGKPISVSSGARCPKHNAAVKGAKKSAHIEGRAIDIIRTPELLTFIMTRLDLYNIAIEDPEKTPTWIHLTDRLPPSGKRIIYI